MAPNSSYAVTLHFPENYYGVVAPPLSPPRMFNVYANHISLLRDFDVSRFAGGPLEALVKTYSGIKPNPFDKIIVDFEPLTDYGFVSAVEVADEAR